MNLDLRKYGTAFTRDDIYTELAAIGASPSDIQYVTIAPGSSIPDYAFYDETVYYTSVFPNLELVYNLATCVSIGQYAFSYCYQLRNTNISKVEVIGYAAFEGCSGLTEIKIKPGISLPPGCFVNCNQLSVVYNLNKCTSIGLSAFGSCNSLQNIDISSCSELGEYAFEQCENLTTVKLKPGIALKHGTFRECSNLTTVYNLNKCYGLGPYDPQSLGVFQDCYMLRNDDLSSCTFIGNHAFDGCKSLTSIKLPSEATIEDYAFYDCSNLRRVDNLWQCNQIGAYAFQHCGSLLPDLDISGVRSIGTGAFYDTPVETLKLGDYQLRADIDLYEWFGERKSLLREVTIPVGVSVPDNMFAECNSLNVVRNLAYATGIGKNAFYNCTSLSNNALWSCSSIGDCAFLGCSSVTFSQISNMPYETTIIGSSAFANCEGITKMNIKAYNIGMQAFENCYNLSQVSIFGASVQDQAFLGCSNLEKVELYGSVAIYKDGIFRDCANLKEVTLSTETFGIGNWCFAGCSSLKKIYNLGVIKSTWIGLGFLSGVNLEHNTIGVSAECLTSDTLGECNMPEWNLPNIYGSEAIAKGYFGAPNGTTFNCKDGTIYTRSSDTTKVWFDDGTYHTVVASNLTRGHFIDAGLMTSEYEWQRQPTRVVLGTNIFALGYELFKGCHKLSTVVMNSGINKIEGGVFANCTTLQNIDLTGVSSIGASAFEGCTSLKSAIIPNVDDINACVFKECTSLSKLGLSPSLTNIEYDAFKNCTSLSSITIPSTVNYMGGEAFAGSGLVTVNIKSSSALSIDNSGFGQFKDCANLTKVTLPSSGCEIPNMCFENCNKLQTVYDLYKCTKIGNNAFFGCSALTNNNIGQCTSIGDNAFQGCSAITKITVKSGATMGNNSFMGCGNIGTMYYLNSISSIGDNALSEVSLSHNTIKALDSGLTSKSLARCFNDSWNLPNVYISEAIAKNWYGANYGVTLKCKDGTTTSNNYDTLSTINGTDKVLLKGIVDWNALQAAGYDPDSINTIEFGTGVTGIGYNAFYDCNNLTSVTIPDSVTSIDDGAFQNCVNLTSLTIHGNNMKSIGEYAFYGCCSLGGEETEVKIPDSVTDIGDYAFAGCSNLTIMPIPMDVKRIGDSAFYNCSNMMGTAVLTDNITSIGHYAFYGCCNMDVVIQANNLKSIGQGAFEGCKHITFYGKTLEQLQSMENYSWGVDPDYIFVG